MLKLTRTLELKGTKGEAISIDITDLALTDEEAAALDKLQQTKDPSKLSAAERELLQKRRATVTSLGAHEEFFARLDVSIVRID